VKARIFFVALAIAGYAVFGKTVSELSAPEQIEAAIQTPPAAHSEADFETALHRSIAKWHAIAFPRNANGPPAEAAPRAGYSAATLPSLDPGLKIATLPTVTAPREPEPRREPERAECDPAYPEERTCIPPGPPFDQGCAVTPERLFVVRAPDPQALDHDGDGIGCEPIT